MIIILCVTLSHTESELGPCTFHSLQEGEVLLEGKELKKTRAKTAGRKTKEAEKALKSPRVKRTTTIAQTAQVRLCMDSRLSLAVEYVGSTVTFLHLGIGLIRGTTSSLSVVR